MKTRAQLAKEPRTAQFLVERVCPVEKRSQLTTERATATFPIVVWVDLSNPITLHPSDLCRETSYRVRSKEALRHRSKVGLTTSGDFRVCEHMGRLIE